MSWKGSAEARSLSPYPFRASGIIEDYGVVQCNFARVMKCHCTYIAHIAIHKGFLSFREGVLLTLRVLIFGEHYARGRNDCDHRCQQVFDRSERLRLLGICRWGTIQQLLNHGKQPSEACRHAVSYAPSELLIETLIQPRQLPELQYSFP